MMVQDEGRRRFGELVRRYRAERGVSLAWVASMLSHPPHGQIWTGSGIRQLQNGERKITPALADQLIKMLDMDEDEAYEALGWWPKGITRRDITDLRRERGTSERRRRRDDPGDVPAAVGVPA
jgi:Helix-turn-helix domain